MVVFRGWVLLVGGIFLVIPPIEGRDACDAGFVFVDMPIDARTFVLIRD